MDISEWKSAVVCPIPKKNPPKTIEQDLRPIALTSLLAKELERFVVKIWKGTDNLLRDVNQYGNTKGLSTTMLVNMIHTN